MGSSSDKDSFFPSSFQSGARYLLLNWNFIKYSKEYRVWDWGAEGAGNPTLDCYESRLTPSLSKALTGRDCHEKGMRRFERRDFDSKTGDIIVDLLSEKSNYLSFFFYFVP